MPPLATSDRLALRELRVCDASALLALYGDPTVTQHLSFESRTSDDVDRIIGAAIESAAVESRIEYLLGVTHLPSDELMGVGRIALEVHRSAQIGFALLPDFWGQGLGTELARLLVRHAIADLGAHRVWGARSPENELSGRVLERAGLAEEGRIRHHVLVRDAWRDSIIHAGIEDEIEA